LELLKQKIILVGHVTESYGPMQAFPKYLAKNVGEFIVIVHPFYYSGILNSTCVLYKNGQEIKKLNGPRYKTLQIMHFFGDFWFLAKLEKKWDIFIGYYQCSQCR
jgi:hypothetical protein